MRERERERKERENLWGVLQQEIRRLLEVFRDL
jgi:hypothetical protein